MYMYALFDTPLTTSALCLLFVIMPNRTKHRMMYSSRVIKYSTRGVAQKNNNDITVLVSFPKYYA